MYVIENLKKTVQQVIGSRPSPEQARHAVRSRKPQATHFEDDGAVPNNPKLPFIHYRSPLRLTNSEDPAALFEKLFESNGWKGSWRNGIYDYVHYHSKTHEVLGIARGEAHVRFGGDKGKVIDLHAGDVVVLPAGTGHQRISATRDLLVVGAYPTPDDYDECRGSAAEHEAALKRIPKVRVPPKDPVYGASGPLTKLWR
jgi:uncharacterized protein YjlB